MCSFSHLNMPEVRMSDLRSVQFDICDGHGEVVSIASDIYINICFGYNPMRRFEMVMQPFNM